MARTVDEDELIEHWTLIGDELGQVAGKRGPTRLGFGLLLRFYTRHGRFPRGRGELPDEAVAYVARQVGVPATDLAFYEWNGRTVEYHRAQIRKFCGFRECTVADAEKLGAWLAEEVCQRERRPERVREQLLKHCRDEGIEQPAPARIGRIIGSGLRQAEKTLVATVAGRIPANCVLDHGNGMDDVHLPSPHRHLRVTDSHESAVARSELAPTGQALVRWLDAEPRSRLLVLEIGAGYKRPGRRPPARRGHHPTATRTATEDRADASAGSVSVPQGIRMRTYVTVGLERAK